MKRFPDYNDMLNANLRIFEETHQKFGKGLKKYEEVINVLMKICYRIVHVDKNSQHFIFHTYASYKYYELPISFRSVITLMEQGLYSDSFNLIRSLLENLVKLKYFHKYPESIENFEVNGKDSSGKRIRIVDMYTAIGAGEAYSVIYKHLSKFEHKSFGSETIQLNKLSQSNSNPDISLIPVFSLQLAGALMNYLMYILYGYLNSAPTFFSYDEKLVGGQSIKSWLQNLIVKHKEKFPEASALSETMNKIVNQ